MNYKRYPKNSQTVFPSETNEQPEQPDGPVEKKVKGKKQINFENRFTSISLIAFIASLCICAIFVATNLVLLVVQNSITHTVICTTVLMSASMIVAYIIVAPYVLYKTYHLIKNSYYSQFNEYEDIHLGLAQKISLGLQFAIGLLAIIGFYLIIYYVHFLPVINFGPKCI